MGKEKDFKYIGDWLQRWNYTTSGSQRRFYFLDKENQVICSLINYFLE